MYEFVLAGKLGRGHKREIKAEEWNHGTNQSSQPQSFDNGASPPEGAKSLSRQSTLN